MAELGCVSQSASTVTSGRIAELEKSWVKWWSVREVNNSARRDRVGAPPKGGKQATKRGFKNGLSICKISEEDGKDSGALNA